MSKYECPECGGRFPEPGTPHVTRGTRANQPVCPWCGEALEYA